MLDSYAVGRLIILDEMRAAAGQYAKQANALHLEGRIEAANVGRILQQKLLEFAKRIEERMPEFPCA